MVIESAPSPLPHNALLERREKMSERNFMLEAKALTERGKYSEATNVLKAGVEQADELQDRMWTLPE
jgi:hypothetical protein